MKHITRDELKEHSNLELINILKTSWGFNENEPIQVYGELNISHNTKGNKHYRLYKVRSLNTDEYIEYPIQLLTENTIENDGIYIPQDNNLKGANNNILISCTLELSHNGERKIRNNPLLVNAQKNSLNIIHEIEKQLIVLNGATCRL
jgi:hypothetical protein